MDNKNQHIVSTTQLSEQYALLTQADSTMVYKNHSYYSMNSKKVMSSIAAQTQVPANISNAVVDFKIDASCGLDVLEYPILQVSYLFSGTGSLQMCASPFALQRIEISQNGGSILHVIHQQELYFQNFFIDRATYEGGIADVQFLGTNYADSLLSVSGGGGIAIWQLPIFSFFKQLHLCITALRQPLLVRLYFNPASLLQSNATTPFNCTNMQMLLVGRKLQEKNRIDLINLYNNGRIPLSLAHLQIDRQTTTLNLASSSNYKIVLSGLNGVCSFIIFTVRLASTYNTFGAAQHTYVAIDSFDIQDSSSVSLIGSYPRNATTQKLQWTTQFANNAQKNLPFNYVSFALDPRDGIANGAVSGHHIFSGNEILVINTTSGLSSDSYIVDIYAYMHENLLIDARNGTMRTTR